MAALFLCPLFSIRYLTGTACVPGYLSWTLADFARFHQISTGYFPDLHEMQEGSRITIETSPATEDLMCDCRVWPNHCTLGGMELYLSSCGQSATHNLVKRTITYQTWSKCNQNGTLHLANHRMKIALTKIQAPVICSGILWNHFMK